MTDYTKSTNFTSKDSLSSGDPLKIVKGAEFDTEFNAIATAIATKYDSSSTIPVASGGTGATTAAAARTNLGLVIGTNVQAWDADLDTWATKTPPSGAAVGTTDTQTLTNKTLTSPSITNPTISGAVVSSMASSVISSGTSVSSTSGTSIDFTSIPSWVKRITILFAGVSLSGASNLLVQIGSGSVTTTGYAGGAWAANTVNTSSSVGFLVTGTNEAARRNNGQMIISNMGSNTWVQSVVTFDNINNNGGNGGGYITLGGTLDRVRITSVNGTDTFDAGSINVLYE